MRRLRDATERRPVEGGTTGRKRARIGAVGAGRGPCRGAVGEREVTGDRQCRECTDNPALAARESGAMWPRGTPARHGRDTSGRAGPRQSKGRPSEASTPRYARTARTRASMAVRSPASVGTDLVTFSALTTETWDTLARSSITSSAVKRMSGPETRVALAEVGAVVADHEQGPAM